MKKLITLIVVTAALFASSLKAAVVSLTWDQNPELDLREYVVAWGGTPDVFTGAALPDGTLAIPFPLVVATVPALVPGQTYHFAVKAVNIYGLDSEWSNIVAYTVPRTPPGKPINLRIIILP